MSNSKLELHNLDVQGFMKAIDQCTGDVFLETADGDSLNLKSKLCQMIGLMSIIEGGMIAEATIRCQLPEDETILFRYNLYGKTE